MNPNEIQLIDTAVARAKAASRTWSQTSPTLRARLLDGLADTLEQHRDELVAIADQESGLGLARLTGEVARTAYQLRGFAQRLREEQYLRPVLDSAVAGAPPAGRPRLQRIQRALGPVAMFSASNFPFAFSVLGGDTASALAAGCPVVVKAHSGHPRLSQAVYALAAAAVAEQGLPTGVLGLVDGASRAAGVHLVSHPDIAAVAFTGSFRGGTALWRTANERPRPIPFYGELGSINPLLAMPAILEREGPALATLLASSITQGCGQFCTSPGVIMLFEHPASERFIQQLSEALRPIGTHRMLTPGMRKGFDDGVAHLQQSPDAHAVFGPLADGDGPAPRLFEVQAQAFLDNPALREEVFGPAAVVLKLQSVAQAVQVFEAIGGALTATLWGLEHASADHQELLDAACAIAGRVLLKGVPTGVAICDAQQHGGPWPASTRPESTSVGYAAIHRFLRPMALQDAPDWIEHD